MLWRWIARWEKDADGMAAKAACDACRHWEELALDQGLDPARNVTFSETDTMVAVGISEELDMEFREGPGGWR